MITLVVTFCLVLNPYMCYQMKMVPDDYHAVASQMECVRGGAVGGMQFTMQNAEYFVKGWRCTEDIPDVSAIDKWVVEEKKRLTRMEPQIK
jgi:hypothetical protein